MPIVSMCYPLGYGLAWHPTQYLKHEYGHEKAYSIVLWSKSDGLSKGISPFSRDFECGHPNVFQICNRGNRGVK